MMLKEDTINFESLVFALITVALKDFVIYVFTSFPSALAVRMSPFFNLPAPIPIKSTLPRTEALLSAPSVS